MKLDRRRVADTAARFAAHWWFVAANCPDLRLLNAGLSQLEIDGSEWAREEDMRHGIDALATAPNGHETRLATRTQQLRYGKYATITLRQTEVVRIACGEYLADLHVQMYCDLNRLNRVVIVAYTDAFRTHLDYVADNDPRWRLIDEPGQPRTRMLVINVATLKSLGALVWHWPIDRTTGGAMTDAAENGPPTTPAVVERPEKSAMARHYNDLWTLARLTTNTEMVPKALRGRPDAALAVMVYGAELGLAPMTALREVFIIEGTPSCSAKLMRALILRAGHRLIWGDLTRDRAVLHGRRRDKRSEATVEWTIDDARSAGVAGKQVWKQYPRSMLAARATSELARLIFPDVTIGYTPEELGGATAHFGEYDSIDVEAGDLPGYVDPVTGEILEEEDADEIDEDTPAHVVAAAIFDAEDAMDAEWLAAARAEADADDQAAARAEEADNAET